MKLYVGKTTRKHKEKTSQCTCYLAIDQRSQRKIVKQLCEELPNVRIAVLSKTFIVETVHLRDLATFMVPSQNRYSSGIANLQGVRKSNPMLKTNRSLLRGEKKSSPSESRGE